jgi:hypothetical protein
MAAEENQQHYRAKGHFAVVVVVVSLMSQCEA